jgi:large subunit ribosomal protein L1
MAEDNVLEGINKIIKERKKRRYKQSVELVINLRNIDMKNPSNRIDQIIALPEGKGKESKIAVFASGESAFKAEEIAEKVIRPEELKDYAKDKRKSKQLANEYDFFLAEAPLMLTIGKMLGKVLGPRGKMPRPVPPDADLKPVADQLKKSIRLRSHSTLTCHALVGNEEMKPEAISKNVEAVIKRAEDNLPQGKANIVSVFVKTTMGSPVRIL